MRRSITVTICALALALAGCGSSEPATLPSGESPITEEITVAVVNPVQRAARFSELCDAHCEPLISAIREPACETQMTCDLQALDLSKRLKAYSDGIQEDPMALNLTDADAPWIRDVADGLAGASAVMNGTSCAGLTRVNAAAFGKCSNEMATLREDIYTVGITLESMAGG